MAGEDRITEEKWSVTDFGALLDRANIWRAYVLYENGEIRLSHEELAPVRSFFERSRDFAQHEAVFFERERRGLNTIFTAFVHDTRRGLAQGGLRLWKYESMADLLSDGLRLSQGMTRKNALADLHWGGGKGIIALPPNVPSVEGYKDAVFAEERKRLFEAYGRFVASLGGVYYTAEDMGTVTTDMNVLLANNRFTTCVAKDRGGSGNPSAHTAWGVFKSMQAAWQHLHGTDDLKGVRVAVQGAGNVGAPLIEYLHRAGATLIIGEFAPSIREQVRARYRDADVLDDHEQIFDAEAEIFAPCARGNVLNPGTIARLRVQLVCGAANNQLGEPHDAELLHDQNILYVPDYLCNRTGIMNCADEWAGYLEEDVALATERLYTDTERVLRQAQERGISTARAADDMADAAAAELHPMLGHRGRRIIEHLVRSGWSTQQPAGEPKP
ncbi:MAG TPA: Glu/Leu/Phe/Val dehydrogenase dimerization domain-containing protein [Thermoanaerobaculia bacterium]|nr:Glu/Leu/Phe/Val dehydrogenase dimerization domain-containing protein [Thermoanaerobaculia bacterium]